MIILSNNILYNIYTIKYNRFLDRRSNVRVKVYNGVITRVSLLKEDFHNTRR